MNLFIISFFRRIFFHSLCSSLHASYFQYKRIFAAHLRGLPESVQSYRSEGWWCGGSVGVGFRRPGQAAPGRLPLMILPRTHKGKRQACNVAGQVCLPVLLEGPAACVRLRELLSRPLDLLQYCTISKYSSHICMLYYMQDKIFLELHECSYIF